MVEFSGIFRCYKRPRLTLLCLDRISEMLKDYDYELIAVYDGEDVKYMNMLEEYCTFIAFGGVMGNNFNVATSMCRGKYILHFENDFYWISRCIEEAVEALDHVDVVRLCLYPFTERSHIQRREKELGVFKDTVEYQFSFNPHMRKEKFPACIFPPVGAWKIEPLYTDMFAIRGKIGGCLMENHFTHLGIYNSIGGYSHQHLGYFVGHNWRDIELSEVNLYEKFNRLSDNPFHRRLFKEYLVRNGYER